MAKEGTAEVDVIVPCYNYGRFLPTCVASILEQPIRDVRVLIIDDASTDGSADVARQLAAADPRVSTILHARNQGHINTYNEGIDWAAADYMMLLSADDLLVPGALKRAVDILDAHPDVVFVHGDCIEWEGDLPLPEATNGHEDEWTRRSGASLIWEFCYCGFNVVHTPTVIVRTAVQKAVGGYRPHLPHSGDMEMFLRFAAHGSVACVRAAQAFKRTHGSNMSNPYLDEKWRNCRQRKEAFDSFFAEYAEQLPDSHSMRSRADREMAESAFWIGLAQIFQGKISSGRSLLDFAIGLCPRLRYRPPISRLMREPDLTRHVMAVFRGGFAHLAKRTRTALPRS